MDRAPQVLQNRIEEGWREFGAHHAASVLEGFGIANRSTETTVKLDLTADVSAMVALYLVRAMTSQNIMTTDQAAKVLATTAGWLEQIENEFPEAYRSTPELREVSRRAKACATMLREQGLSIPYGAPLTFKGEAK